MLNKVDSVGRPARRAPDRWLMVEAALWLAAARIATVTIPFRWIMSLLALRPGDGAAQNPAVPGGDSLAFARLARRALTRAARRTPWQSNCLTKTLAGAGMLRVRHIAALMAVGVKQPVNSRHGMKAHAWLSSGDVIVAGGSKHKSYNTIATFAYRPDPSCNAPVFGFFPKN